MSMDTAAITAVAVLILFLFYKKVHNQFFHERRKRQRRKIRDRRVGITGRRKHRDGEVDFKHRDYRFHDSDRRSGERTRRRHKRRIKDRNGANLY